MSAAKILRQFLGLLLGAVLLAPLAAWGAGCSRALDLETSKKLQEAQEVFNKAQSREDFLHAAALYEEVVREGIHSGPLFYNLGNAYMQADERGRAIAAYRMAQRYMPRNAFLAANLTSALGESDAGQGRKGLLDHVLFWKDWLSYPEKYALLIVSASLALLLALIALAAPRPRRWRRPALAMLVVVALIGLSAGFDTYRFKGIERGVVVQKEVVARKGNSDSYEPSFTQPLTEGTEFQVQEKRNFWLLIRLKEGPEGWIPADAAVTYGGGSM